MEKSKKPTLSQEVGKSLDKNAQKQRYYRKNSDFFGLIQKIKLWPSRSGVLHGIKTIEITGKTARITTHCGETFVVYNSKNSRAARWLRNKWSFSACKRCATPQWKLEKYSATLVKNDWGAKL
jgi:pyrrolysyl-tRNA synthetase-like protein